MHFSISHRDFVPLVRPPVKLIRARPLEFLQPREDIHRPANSGRHDSCHISNVPALPTDRSLRPVQKIGALAMSISRLLPPLDYLRAASRSSLQSFEMARLNHAANLRREIAALIDQWIQETSEATLARWMLDHQKSLQESPSSSWNDTVSPSRESAADLLPPPPAAPVDIVPAPPRFSDARPIRGPIKRKSQKPRSTAIG